MSTRGKVTALNQPARAGGANAGGSATLHGLIESTVRVPAAGVGGPLVDAQGYVIGMNNAQAFGAPGRTTSFAIPIDGAAIAVARICRG